VEILEFRVLNNDFSSEVVEINQTVKFVAELFKLDILEFNDE
jgi:hypothetical protein